MKDEPGCSNNSASTIAASTGLNSETSSSSTPRDVVELLGAADVLPNFGKAEPPKPPPKPAPTPKPKRVPPPIPPDILALEKYRCGWRPDTCKSMTMAELYLLMGKPTTGILLEYEWVDKVKEEPPPTVVESVNGVLLPTPSASIAPAPAAKQPAPKPRMSQSSQNLKRLVHLASVQFKELKVRIKQW